MAEIYRKTCVNCKHYHPVLACTENDFHIHDYCSVWMTRIPDGVVCERLGYEACYTDIECGVATCFAFDVKEGQLKYLFPNMGDFNKTI